MPCVFQICSGAPATLKTLCIRTGELCVHRVHLFTKLGTFPLTKSCGFPTPCVFHCLRGPGPCWNFFADGTPCLRGAGHIPRNCRVTGVTGMVNLLNLKVENNVTSAGSLPRVRCNDVERCNAIDIRRAPRKLSAQGSLPATRGGSPRSTTDQERSIHTGTRRAVTGKTTVMARITLKAFAVDVHH